MAVLITGLSIPKTGIQAFTIDADGNVSLGIFENNPVGKAKELPPSHGNLKDTDDIINRLALKPTHDVESTLLSIQSAIDESPTIIPAENVAKEDL